LKVQNPTIPTSGRHAQGPKKDSGCILFEDKKPVKTDYSKAGRFLYVMSKSINPMVYDPEQKNLDRIRSSGLARRGRCGWSNRCFGDLNVGSRIV